MFLTPDNKTGELPGQDPAITVATVFERTARDGYVVAYIIESDNVVIHVDPLILVKDPPALPPAEPMPAWLQDPNARRLASLMNERACARAEIDSLVDGFSETLCLARMISTGAAQPDDYNELTARLDALLENARDLFDSLSQPPPEDL